MRTRYTYTILILFLTAGLLLTPAAVGTNAQNNLSASVHTLASDAFADSPVALQADADSLAIPSKGTDAHLTPLTGIVKIAAGGEHTCALTTEGGVKCWGKNGFGQLGDGTTTDNRGSPVNVTGLNSGVVSITAGDRHTCALTTAGGVKCWGWNRYGQLGDFATFIWKPSFAQA